MVGRDEVAGGSRKVPELAGVREVAEILGVGKGWVTDLERERRKATAGEKNPFPAPVQRLATGPVWVRAEVEAFARNRRDSPGPAPGTVARRPRALSSVPIADLERAIADPRAGLSDRERRVLRMRLGLEGSPPGDPVGAGSRADGRPMGQRAVSEELGVSLPTVKLDQRSAVEKVLGALGRPPEGGAGS